MASPIRAFLAVEIPVHVKNEIASRRQRLVEELPRAGWVRPEGQHLTLKFLGDVDQTVLSNLGELLEPRLRELQPVTVRLTGTGFFPSVRRPRVAWIGGSADGAGAVVETVETIAEGCGLDRERRRWSIHITQARLKDRWSEDDVDQFLEWGNRLDLEPFEAGEVVLFSSDLRPTGAVYTALGRFPLG
jgi:2'-5' RNA ligase